jgi:DNA-binding PadR family transcriptional regulator
MGNSASEQVLHILLALSDRPRHGYAIVQEIEQRTGGSVLLGTGTLYTALKRLREGGLIEEAEDPDAPATDDRRRRTYTLTRRGRSELADQAERLNALVDHARQKRVIPTPRPAS